jgi:glycerophosphoryl diester phosphodiesterase
MNYYYLIIGFLLFSSSCKPQSEGNHSSHNRPTIEAFIKNLEDSKNDQIMVIAHRGISHNAPENSLQAIQNSIEMGVDMVEIDIRVTKDGKLVLMHDQSIDRTTNGKGNVKDWTLEQLKTLNLVDHFGSVTVYKIPTLEEALLLSKDKILINLDKSYNYFDKCYKVMKKTGTLKQVVIKGEKTRSQVESEYGQYLDEIYFMPIVQLPSKNAKRIIDDYLKHRAPISFEFIIRRDPVGVIDNFDEIREKGANIWVNALGKKHNAGHDDEKAAQDPTVYDWYIENNINMIQTNQPELLINYLREKGLHW